MDYPFQLGLVDGDIRRVEEITISLAHSVFLTSLGVYESIQVDQGRPFHLEDHLQRLCASAHLIDLHLPPVPEMLGWGETLIQRLPQSTYALQILVVGPEEPAYKPIIAFIPKPIRTYPPDFYRLGASAISFEGQRALPQCKSFNTLVNHLARMAAGKAGAIEAILTHNNELFEGARSNLFAVVGGRLVTPSRIQTLSGITSDIVLQVMQNTPYPVSEGSIFLNSPLSELFITSTSMHVLPVTHFNGKKIGDGKVGPVTRMVMSNFEDYYANYLSGT